MLTTNYNLILSLVNFETMFECFCPVYFCLIVLFASTKTTKKLGNIYYILSPIQQQGSPSTYKISYQDISCLKLWFMHDQ